MVRQSVFLILFACLVGMMGVTASYAKAPDRGEDCPCEGSINALKKAYTDDPKFQKLITDAFQNMQQLPQGYPSVNPWIGKDFADLVSLFEEWCTFLPLIHGTSDTGLKYIQKFAWFYYKNEFGLEFVKKSPGLEITRQFAIERGKFMDSEDSTKFVAEWLSDVRIEKQDYKIPDPSRRDGGFKSFNQFFARTLEDQEKSRPQTMPERDYIIAAPTDCIMNSVPQYIADKNTLIPTKLNQALNIDDMLDNSKHAEDFIGGTALSCVLMPNTYHHYHAPVGGEVIESRIIDAPYYGYNDFPKWVPPNGNVGYYGTDFSEFEQFKRGYFIIQTKFYGKVALIPVGLDTISSIQFEPKYNYVTKPVPVKRGDRLGHFLYGGSLCIMIFEPGKYGSDAIQVRLGNQIGTFDTKSNKAPSLP